MSHVSTLRHASKRVKNVNRGCRNSNKVILDSALQLIVWFNNSKSIFKQICMYMNLFEDINTESLSFPLPVFKSPKPFHIGSTTANNMKHDFLRKNIK